MFFKFLNRVIKFYDTVINVAAILGGILVFYLVISVSFEVVMRYFLGKPTIWVVEMAGYALVYIPFLVAAWVLRRDGHVKMDLLLNRLKPKLQSLMSTIIYFMGAVICVIVTWYGVKATIYFIGFKTVTALMMPQSYIMVIIPVGSLLFFIECLRKTYNSFKAWRANKEEEGPLNKRVSTAL